MLTILVVILTIQTVVDFLYVLIDNFWYRHMAKRGRMS